MPGRWFIVDIETEETKPNYGDEIFYIGTRNHKNQRNIFLHHDEFRLIQDFSAWFQAQNQNYDFVISAMRSDVSYISHQAMVHSSLNPPFDPAVLVNLYHFPHQEIAEIMGVQEVTLDDIAKALQIPVSNPDRKLAPNLWARKQYHELRAYLEENLMLLHEAWLRQDELKKTP